MAHKNSEHSGQRSLSIRDLSDLCAQWSEIQHHVRGDGFDAEQLPPESREIIRWLCHLADKACVMPKSVGLNDD